MRGDRRGLRRLLLGAVLLGYALIGATAAPASSPLRVVRYHGYTVRVPRSWPVYQLANDRSRCVRFDRHALYLGTPAAEQRCPGVALGRTEAILIAPLSSGSAAQPLPGGDGSSTSFLVRSDGIAVTATWSTARSVVVRALGRHSLPPSPAAPPSTGATAPAPRAAASRSLEAHVASSVYTGRGFDACSAPSSRAMSAWGSSPYRAIGVYIGGPNSACSQPNLTPSWVSTQVGAGWHLILTYVGLQAPSNSCGCAGIRPSQARAEGTAAANQAVANAQALGIPVGNPIYDDMEGYGRGGTNTSAVLSFLSAWTAQLHADGYASGVYSSGGSGVSDLAGRYGSGYLEPDDIWVADWNGLATTSDPYVPAGDWSNHQRIHQYRGAHNETHGGATINIDSDFVDGATADTAAGSAGPAHASPRPKLKLSAGPDGTMHLYLSWPHASGVRAWRVLAGANSNTRAMTSIARKRKHGALTRIAVRSSARFFAVQAMSSSGGVISTSKAVAAPAHLAIFGRNLFVAASTGVGTLASGCYTGRGCNLVATLSAKGKVIAKSTSQSVGGYGAGLLSFRLTSKGRAMLLHAAGHRLGIRATLHDASGKTATVSLNAIPFSATGIGASPPPTQTSTLQIVGSTDFVSSNGRGWILAGCRTVVCHVRVTLSANGTVIAHTGPQLLGANELGYLGFSLTAKGRAMLAAATGNHLAVRVKISDGRGSATARIALVGFS